MQNSTQPDFLQNYLTAKDASRQRGREDVADQMQATQFSNQQTQFGQQQAQHNALQNLDIEKATPKQLMQAGMHNEAFQKMQRSTEEGKALMSRMLAPLQKVREAGYTQESYDQALQAAAMLPGWEYVRDKIPAMVDPKIIDGTITALEGTIDTAPGWQMKELKDGDIIRTVWMDTNPRSKSFNTMQPVAEAYANKPPEGFDRGPDGSLSAIPAYWDQKTKVAAAGASRVNVSNQQEKEEAKTVGKGYGEVFLETQKAGNLANAKIAKNQRLAELLKGVDTGKLTPAGTEVASFAQSLGITIDPKLGNKQAAAALAGEMALDLRNPAGGAGMPGAMSDADRQFLVSMVPGLATTPQGRAQMLETSNKLAKRDQQVATMARKYRAKRGSLDEGFYNELQAFSDANPLFGGGASTTAKTSGLTQQEQQELQALKRRFGK